MRCMGSFESQIEQGTPGGVVLKLLMVQVVT